MSRKKPQLYVYHILESIEHIENFMKNLSKEEFFSERMRYDATLRNLQTMSESSKRLPKEVTDKYPEIPWKDIAGFRNILVHDYLEGLDENVVWNVINHEIKPLKHAMLKECPNWHEIKSNPTRPNHHQA